MATKRRRIKRRKPVDEVEVEDVEEVEEEEIEELEELEEEDDEELEEEEPAPKPKRSRRKRSPRKVEELEEEEFDDEPESEPEPEPAARKKAVPPVKKDIEVRKVDDQIAESVLSGLLDLMDTGQSIIATRLSATTWQFANADTVAIPTGPKLKGKEFKDEVQTEEYKEWHEEWADMTYQEKKVYAKKLKVKWDEHKDQRVDNIRMSSAVRAKLNIEKYKPEYIDKSARDRLQGK